MYFHSLLTVTGVVVLDKQKYVSMWVPNMVFASTYLGRVLPALSAGVVDLIGAVRRPSAFACRSALQHLVSSQCGPLSSQQFFRENTLQGVINIAVSKTSEPSNAGFSTLTEHVVNHGTDRQLSERGQVFVPQANSGGQDLGGADLVLTSADGSSTVHLELKVLTRSRLAQRAVRAVPHRVSYEYLSPPKTGLDRGHVPDDVVLAAELKPGHKINLSRNGHSIVSTKEQPLCVEDVLNSTLTQAAENASGLLHLYENLRSFAVVMVGYRFFVTEVSAHPGAL